MSTPSETDILAYLREHGPLSQRLIHKIYAQTSSDPSETSRDVRYRTLYGKLNDLFTAGKIKRTRAGKSYVYALLDTDPDALQAAVERELAGAPLTASLGDIDKGKLLALRSRLRAAVDDVEDMIDDL